MNEPASAAIPTASAPWATSAHTGESNLPLHLPSGPNAACSPPMAYEIRAPVKMRPFAAPSAETHTRTPMIRAATPGKVPATVSTATAPDVAVPA